MAASCAAANGLSSVRDMTKSSTPPASPLFQNRREELAFIEFPLTAADNFFTTGQFNQAFPTGSVCPDHRHLGELAVVDLNADRHEMGFLLLNDNDVLL